MCVFETKVKLEQNSNNKTSKCYRLQSKGTSKIIRSLHPDSKCAIERNMPKLIVIDKIDDWVCARAQNPEVSRLDESVTEGKDLWRSTLPNSDKL